MTEYHDPIIAFWQWWSYNASNHKWILSVIDFLSFYIKPFAYIILQYCELWSVWTLSYIFLVQVWRGWEPSLHMHWRCCCWVEDAPPKVNNLVSLRFLIYALHINKSNNEYFLFENKILVKSKSFIR